jgi:hypothetical protein
MPSNVRAAAALITGCSSGIGHATALRLHTAGFRDTNFFGLARLTQLVVPGMRTHGGRIINLSSVFGRFAVPGGAYYAASKPGLRRLRPLPVPHSPSGHGCPLSQPSPFQRAHLMDPVTVWQQPRVLARGDDRPAPLADLAGGVRFVVFRVEILQFLLFPLVLLDLVLAQILILAVRWREAPGLPLFLAVVGPEVRPYSHHASWYVRLHARYRLG